MAKITEKDVLKSLQNSKKSNWDLMAEFLERDKLPKQFNIKVYNAIRYRLKRLEQLKRVTSEKVLTNDNKFKIVYKVC